MIKSAFASPVRRRGSEAQTFNGFLPAREAWPAAIRSFPDLANMMQQLSVRDFVAAAHRPTELAVIIPVLNERANIEPLLSGLALALIGIEWEAIFVDDASSDGTPDVIAAIAATDRRIRLIRRFGRRGLSSAVMEGILASTTPVVAIIDADLQHDERILPELYYAVAGGDYELAIGTRYSNGGSIGDWAASRAKISDLATRLAAPLLKTPLSDPMSGFFAVRREAVLAAVPRLSKVGYKILLDLVASSPKALSVKEFPYNFRARRAGESKLDSAIALEYLELLLDKMVGRWVPVKLIMFGAVGGLGLFVQLSLLWVLLAGAGWGFSTAQTLAVICTMTFNFSLNNRFTYRDRRLTGRQWLKGLLSFYAVCSAGALANVGAGTMLFESYQTWWVAGALGAVIGAVWNYVATSWLTWSRH